MSWLAQTNNVFTDGATYNIDVVDGTVREARICYGGMAATSRSD